MTAALPISSTLAYFPAVYFLSHLSHLLFVSLLALFALDFLFAGFRLYAMPFHTATNEPIAYCNRVMYPTFLQYAPVVLRSG